MHKIDRIKKFAIRIAFKHDMKEFNKQPVNQIHSNKLIFVSYCKRCGDSIILTMESNLTGLPSLEGSALTSNCKGEQSEQ